MFLRGTEGTRGTRGAMGCEEGSAGGCPARTGARMGCAVEGMGGRDYDTGVASTRAARAPESPGARATGRNDASK